MKVRLLASTTAPRPQRQFLTTLLVNDTLAIDAGSLTLALTAEELQDVHHILITHAHIDHIASLPIFLAEAFPSLASPVVVHATPEVIDALRRFVFNDAIWPDFARIPLPDGRGPALEFRPLEPFQPVMLGNLRVTPIRVNHVVPSVGFLVEDQTTGFAVTSDTYTTDEIWVAAGRSPRIRAVLADVSYPNEMEDLAAASGHHTPRSLAADLKKMARNIPVFALHIKPADRETVVRQLAELGDPRIGVMEIGRTYAW